MQVIDMRNVFPDSVALRDCDPAKDVWHIHTDTASFAWNWRTDCYGHPAGTCKQKQTDGPYCRRCLDAYIEDCKKESLRDKVAELIRVGYEIGTIPSDFKWWKRTGLYPWQVSALSLIDPTCSAWICGSPGTGKTHVAYHRLDALLNQAKDVALGTTQTVLDTYRDQHRRAAFQRAAVLILDDFDKARWTEPAAADIHGILDYRMRNHLPTIVTSEITGKEMGKRLEEVTGKRFGKSTVQRLSWPGSVCVAINMGGDNLRAKKGSSDTLDRAKLNEEVPA